MYEGGLRVPMIVRWPGHIQGGAVNDSVWYFPDVLPTLAEIAHSAASENVDGISMSTALPQSQGLFEQEQQTFL